MSFGSNIWCSRFLFTSQCDFSRNHTTLKQSDLNLRQIVTSSAAFTCAMHNLLGFTLSSHSWRFQWTIFPWKGGPFPNYIYVCFVCNLYSYSDIAHEKSLWIHGISHDIPRTKLWGLAMVYPTESSLPIGKQQMVNTGNCTTQWTHCCDLTLKLRHIAKHLTNSRAWAKRMANFRASLYKN